MLFFLALTVVILVVGVLLLVRSAPLRELLGWSGLHERIFRRRSTATLRIAIGPWKRLRYRDELTVRGLGYHAQARLGGGIASWTRG